MKAVVAKSFAEDFKFSVDPDFPKPVLSEDDFDGHGMIVKVCAGGINPVDYKIAQGHLGKMPLPYIPGCDLAGIVEDPGKSSFAKGDRICAHININEQYGGLCEFTKMDSRSAAIIPASVSFEE
ncbi:NADP-dependent oxidoreductase, partial [Aduncisulcus paluster]